MIKALHIEYLPLKPKTCLNRVEGFFNFIDMNNEIWKPIDEFNGDYDISNLGNVRSWVTQGQDKPYPRKLNKNYGYCYCNFRVGDKYYGRRVHRLVAKAFIPNPENKPCVNHKNGIKDDNRVENLEWVTNSENDIHAYENGLREPMRGEMNGHAVLTEDDILQIRKMYYVDGVSQSILSEKFNVVQCHISEIVNYKRWGHVGGKYKGMDKPVNYSKGEDVYGSKLNPKKVKEMRKLRKETNLSYRQIGERYGINRTSASSAIRGETWSHI